MQEYNLRLVKFVTISLDSSVCKLHFFYWWTLKFSLSILYSWRFESVDWMYYASIKKMGVINDNGRFRKKGLSLLSFRKFADFSEIFF